MTLDCATGRVSKPQESICYLPLSFFKTVRGRKPGFCWNGSERRLATITGVSGEAYSLNLTITLLIISQQLIDPAKHETFIETVEWLAVCVVVLTIPFMSSCTIAMTTLSQRWWKPVSPRGCIRHWTPSVFTSLKMLSRSQWPQPLMSRFIFPDKQAGSLAGCPSLFCRLCHPAYAGHQFLFFTFSSVCISVMMFLCWYVFFMLRTLLCCSNVSRCFKVGDSVTDLFPWFFSGEWFREVPNTKNMHRYDLLICH